MRDERKPKFPIPSGQFLLLMVGVVADHLCLRLVTPTSGKKKVLIVASTLYNNDLSFLDFVDKSVL